jgi:hypothetical protein
VLASARNRLLADAAWSVEPFINKSDCCNEPSSDSCEADGSVANVSAIVFEASAGPCP